MGKIFPGLKTFRLIDVEEMKVMQFSSATLLPSSYVSLSYIWGAASTIRSNTANISLFTQRDGLKNAASFLPRTIMDAITVVQKLKLRYLWVDTLCLIQNDDEDVRLGVAVMDLIYEKAYMVIVAADGHDASAGLPGTSEGTRHERQNSGQVTNELALGLWTDPNASLAKSAYHTRGWTFQEYVLASRALIFVDGRLFFRCLIHYQREDSCQPEPIPHQSAREHGNIEDTVPIPQQSAREHGDINNTAHNRRSWDDFPFFLSDYSSRQFTDEGDALRALDGILRRLSRSADSGTSTGHIQGVPLRSFETMLLFRSADVPLRRRPLFPTFSWAGWRGRQTYQPWASKIAYFTSWINFYLLENENPGQLGQRIHRPTPIGGGRGRHVDPNDAFYAQAGFGHVVHQDKNQELFQTVPTMFRKNNPKTPYSLLQSWTYVIQVSLADLDPIRAVARVIHRGRDIGGAWLDGFNETDFFYSRSEFEIVLLCAHERIASRGSLRAISTVMGGLLVEHMDGDYFERRGAVELQFVDEYHPDSRDVGYEYHFNWQEIVLG